MQLLVAPALSARSVSLQPGEHLAEVASGFNVRKPPPPTRRSPACFKLEEFIIMTLPHLCHGPITLFAFSLAITVYNMSSSQP